MAIKSFANLSVVLPHVWNCILWLLNSNLKPLHIPFDQFKNRIREYFGGKKNQIWNKMQANLATCWNKLIFVSLIVLPDLERNHELEFVVQRWTLAVMVGMMCFAQKLVLHLKQSHEPHSEAAVRVERNSRASRLDRFVLVVDAPWSYRSLAIKRLTKIMRSLWIL